MSGVKRTSTSGVQAPPRPAEPIAPATVQTPAAAPLDAERAVEQLEDIRPHDGAPSASALTLGQAPAEGGGVLGFLRGLLGGAGTARAPARTAPASPSPSPPPPTLQQTVGASKGYAALPAADKTLLDNMLGHGSTLATQQRTALQTLLGTQDWADMTPTQQKNALVDLTRPFKTKLGLEASKAWPTLHDDVKQTMIARLNQPGSEHYADVVGRMIETQGFTRRDAAEQAKLLTQQLPLTTLPKQPKDPGVRSAVRTLLAQPAAAELDTVTGQRLDTLLTGSRNAYAAKARSELVKRTRDPVYAVMTRAEQTAYLGAIAEGTTAAPSHVIGLSVGERRPAVHRLTTAGQPDAYKFLGATQDATMHRVQIGDRSVPILSARGEPVANQSTPAEIARALATLPPAALSVVNKVVLNPVRNPGDVYWEKTFNIKGFRAAATASQDGAVNVFPAASSTRSVHTQAGYLAHEAGHLLAYDAFGKQVGGPGWQRYTDAAKRDGVQPSNYGTGNINEDFAETMQLYLTHREQPDFGELRQLFPARFAVIDEVLAAREAALTATRRRQ